MAEGTAGKGVIEQRVRTPVQVPRHGARRWQLGRFDTEGWQRAGHTGIHLGGRRPDLLPHRASSKGSSHQQGDFWFATAIVFLEAVR